MLLAALGLQNKEIAEQLGIGRVQVARWRERYLESGLQGIERALPRGAPPVKVDVARLVELTTQSTPEAASHWSTRKMAAVLRVSPSTVMRHWQAKHRIDRIHEVFPLVWPPCGGQIRLIAFITHSADIRHILDHIEVDCEPPRISLPGTWAAAVERW